MSGALVRKIAERLAAHAQKALPANRADWARAMGSEVQHISGNRAALAWALGCVLAGYRERLRTMLGNSSISRWILLLEMLCCFTPLTLLCIAVLANLSRMPAAAGMVALSVVATGPVGLLVACKLVVLNRPSLSRFSASAMCVIAAWTLLGYLLQILAGPEPMHAWREFVLIALLPALGIVHLLHLSRRPAGKSTPV